MKKVKTLFNSPNDKTGLVNNFTSLQLFVGSVRSSNVEIGFWSGQGTKLDRPGDQKIYRQLNPFMVIIAIIATNY